MSSMREACSVCGLHFDVQFRYQMEERQGGFAFYCSQACLEKSQRRSGDDGTATCDACATRFRVELVSQVLHVRGQRRYACSMACRTQLAAEAKGLRLGELVARCTAEQSGEVPVRLLTEEADQAAALDDVEAEADAPLDLMATPPANLPPVPPLSRPGQAVPAAAASPVAPVAPVRTSTTAPTLPPPPASSVPAPLVRPGAPGRFAAASPARPGASPLPPPARSGASSPLPPPARPGASSPLPPPVRAGAASPQPPPVRAGASSPLPPPVRSGTTVSPPPPSVRSGALASPPPPPARLNGASPAPPSVRGVGAPGRTSPVPPSVRGATGAEPARAAGSEAPAASPSPPSVRAAGEPAAVRSTTTFPPPPLARPASASPAPPSTRSVPAESATRVATPQAASLRGVGAAAGAARPAATPAGASQPRLVAVFNHKGGTGKTTTSVSLAAGLALRGKRVLLVDADAQGNVAVSLGVQAERSLYHVLVMGLAVHDAITTVRPGLDLLPSNETLAAAELYLAGRQNRDRVLAGRLAPALDGYDYVIVDCSPSLSLLNQNALCLVDSVLVPVACDYLSLVGVRQVIKTVKNVNQLLHHPVRIWGVLPTFFDARAKICNEAVDTLKKHFGDRCLRPIRQAIKVKEAPAQGQTIFEYATGSPAAEDYASLVNTVLGARAAAAASEPVGTVVSA
jgi:chromosome partitioning protein